MSVQEQVTNFYRIQAQTAKNYGSNISSTNSSFNPPIPGSIDEQYKQSLNYNAYAVETIRKNAILADREQALRNSPQNPFGYLSIQNHNGKIIDYRNYQVPNYDYNNPSLVQGGTFTTGTKVLYRDKINADNNIYGDIKFVNTKN